MEKNEAPNGDCVGPDKKHFAATREVCETFNKAWGKKDGFVAGAVTPTQASTPVALATALAQTDTPTGDCVGPDKKHFQAEKDVCEVFNKSWNKPVVFAASAPTPSSSDTQASAGTSSVTEALKQSAEKGSPLGDCIGPDKKHVDASREVCEALNKAWGKKTTFTSGVTTGTAPASTSTTSSGTGGSSSSSGGNTGSSSGGSASTGSTTVNSAGSQNSGSTVSQGENKSETKTETKSKKSKSGKK